MSDPHLVERWSNYVYSSAFDEKCANYKIDIATASTDSEAGYTSDDSNIDLAESDSPGSSIQALRYDVSKVEAQNYYFGLHESDKPGPPLIYRSSKDVFTAPPAGQAPRTIKLHPVFGDHPLGRDDLWDRIRPMIMELLDGRGVHLSCIDLVRFKWAKETTGDEHELRDSEEGGDSEEGKDTDDTDESDSEGCKESDDALESEDAQESNDAPESEDVQEPSEGAADNKGTKEIVAIDKNGEDNGDCEQNFEHGEEHTAVAAPTGDEENVVGEERQLGEENVSIEVNEDITPNGTSVISPVTVWIGVASSVVTLASELAYHCSLNILGILKSFGIEDVDVAFREENPHDCSGNKLFAPVSDIHPLKTVIDPVTTALGLPIAGLKSLDTQGTMGFYFKFKDELYGVTARHVLFRESEGNDQYNYIRGRGPRRKVVLMGTCAYTSLIESTERRIGIMAVTLTINETKAATHKAKLAAREPDVQVTEEEAKELAALESLVKNTQADVDALKKFYISIRSDWDKPADRVIGWAVWAPPISVSTAPHGYTRDVCVIKLDQKMFTKNLKGNVIDLGPEIDEATFTFLMHPYKTEKLFKYPDNRLLRLSGILSAADIRYPNNIDSDGMPVRYVIKHGQTTSTTIGSLTGFRSFVRHYNVLGRRDSVEVAVLPYGHHMFFRGGDSGSLIVDGDGKGVALLTGGTKHNDIAYCTPMYFLWDIIKANFPGATLFF